MTTVRDAQVKDVSFVVDGNMAMALETEGKVLERSVLERGVAAVFERPACGFYLIAEHAEKPVGCLLVTREWSDWRDGDWWWLQSVYVVPDARGTGVFRALYREVERRARQAREVVGLRLYVDADNESAQHVYAAVGMKDARYRLLEREFDDAV